MRCPDQCEPPCCSSSTCRALSLTSSRHAKMPPPTEAVLVRSLLAPLYDRPGRRRRRRQLARRGFAHRRSPRAGRPHPGTSTRRELLFERVVVGSLDVSSLGPVPQPVDGRAGATSWLSTCAATAAVPCSNPRRRTTKARRCCAPRWCSWPVPDRRAVRGRSAGPAGSRGGAAARRRLRRVADDADAPLGALRARAVRVLRLALAAGGRRPATTLCSTRRWARSCRRDTIEDERVSCRHAACYRLHPAPDTGVTRRGVVHL